MPTAPVPAAPTALDPLLMPRRPPARTPLGVPVPSVRVLLLGLCPITAAAAVMLAGCGVRGFTVVDDGRVTWADARAGSFDSTEVGLPRDLCVRRRIRAAHAEAAPVTWTDDVLTDDRPGRAVLRSSRVRLAGSGLGTGKVPGLDGSPEPGGDPEAAPDARRVAELEVLSPGDHLRLPPDVPLVDVLSLPESTGAAVLAPGGPWLERPCPQCRGAIAGQALHSLADEQPSPGSSAAVRAAAPGHTAWCAGLVVQAVLAAALGTGGATPSPSPSGWVLAPGAPFSTRLAGPQRPQGCPLCGG